MKRILRANAAAKEMGVAAKTMNRWIVDGHVPATKIANTWFIREDELEAMFDAAPEECAECGLPAEFIYPKVVGAEGEETFEHVHLCPECAFRMLPELAELYADFVPDGGAA